MRIRSRARRVVALVSGADSEILVAELLTRGWSVYPLYLRCGLRWEASELAHLRRALRSLGGPRLKPLTVVDDSLRPLMRGHWSLTGRGVPGERSRDASVYLPGRNMILLTHAWVHAAARGAGTIAIGTLKGNPFPDATPRFRAAAARALNLALGVRVRLLAPYAGLTKREVLSRAGRFRLELAFSCLAPRRKAACGRCNKCAELAAALAALRTGAPPSSRIERSRPAVWRLRRPPTARRARSRAGA